MFETESFFLKKVANSVQKTCNLTFPQSSANKHVFMNMFQSSESIGSPSVKFGSQAAVCDDAKSEMSCWRKFVQEAKRSVRCGVNGHMV